MFYVKFQIQIEINIHTNHDASAVYHFNQYLILGMIFIIQSFEIHEIQVALIFKKNVLLKYVLFKV